MQAVIVSVDYADLLAITLPYNREQFESVTVITTPTDTKTKAIAEANGCTVLQTDIFYAGGKKFNKFAAIEQALAEFELQGWLCLLDADIRIPKWRLVRQALKIGNIYSPLRRMWVNITQPPPHETDWHTLPYGEPKNATRFAGYMQVFHTKDPVLASRPWHRLDYDNASDGDTAFSRKWANKNKVRPSFDVLHLGLDTKNWCGRTTEYVDGTVPADAAARMADMKAFLQSRKAK